jgi:hypothetical protein
MYSLSAMFISVIHLYNACSKSRMQMQKCELFSKKKRKEKDEISSIAANNKGTDIHPNEYSDELCNSHVARDVAEDGEKSLKP